MISDLFVGKWKIKIVIAVNVARPIVATYAQFWYILVYNEYNTIKVPKISNNITPQIAILYISFTACFKYFLKNTKHGIPNIVILIIDNKNKYKFLFLLYIWKFKII